MENKTQMTGKPATESIGVTEMQKPKTCQRKYLLCGHVYGDDNAEIKTEINQWCDACARELEHGHTPEAIKRQRAYNKLCAEFQRLIDLTKALMKRTESLDKRLLEGDTTQPELGEITRIKEFLEGIKD